MGREDEADRAALERLAKSISRFLSPRQAWQIETLAGEESDYARKCLSSLWYQGMRGIFLPRRCRTRGNLACSYPFYML
ncbi:hypothetical protein GsuE55_34300 [Geobacillus subterraneus]|uniref:Uncharacterized protein n=1 Tax=Geobacillus subterraneus TaxID=129338 RepID=A0A679FWW5_9BACL|nr:hypothetical protein GsuE55_34300 [Geobacillus subterraneus]